MPRKIQADDLLKLKLVGDVQIAPDGKRLAISLKQVNPDKNKYFTNLWLAETDGGEPRQFTFGEHADGQPRWSPDGKHLAFTSNRDKPKSQIYLISTDGGEAHALTSLEEGSVGEFQWSPDGRYIAFMFRPTAEEWTEAASKERKKKGQSTPPRVVTEVFYRLDGDGYFVDQRFKLWVVEVATGEARQLVRDNYFDGDFTWSPDSRSIAYISNHSEDFTETPQLEDIYLVNLDGGEPTKLEGTVQGPKGALNWSPDGRLIAYTGNDKADDVWSVELNHLWVVDLKEKSSRDLMPDFDNNVGAGILGDTRDFGGSYKGFWSADSKSLIFNVGEKGKARLYRATLDGKLMQLSDNAGELLLGSVAADGKTLGVAVADPSKWAEAAVAVIQGDRVEIKSSFSFNKELLSELEIALPEEIWVESTEGTKVHAWVIKPTDFKEGVKYPTLLEVHGGPHMQYGEVLFHEFQLLAANGYVVVYSNPRGSVGYGRDYAAIIRGDWGNRDWQDVSAVADWAAEQPYVDTTRFGILGGSYGGYMTNWAIGHTDRFKAAVTDRCVLNLHSFAGTTDFPMVPEGYWPGNTWDSPEKLWAMSPLKYMGACATPTLIIHSEGDLRCPISQAEELFAALKRRKVKTKLVRYPQESSHGMSRNGPPDLRLHRLDQILTWFEENLK